MRGAHARRNKRLLEIKTLNKKGIQEIGKLTRRELWLIGIALHWAEGSKQRESSLSTGVIFTNSDPHMLSLFLNWLKVLGVEKRDIFFELYVHDSRTQEIPASKIWWSKKLRITPSDFGAVYMKRDKIMTNRKNITDLYHGLIRIKVRSSTSLNRQINGWIEGIVQQ
jgi:hypothetical protein